MKSYLIKRILLFFPTIIGITLVTFILMKKIPGDPVYGMVGKRADKETIISIRKNLNIDLPLWQQYFGYLKLLSRGELGRSYYTNRKIMEDIKEKLPHTLYLASAAMLFAIIIGIGMGILMAYFSSSFWDRFLSFISLASISIPVFWVGLILIFIFSLKLHLFPPGGRGENNLIYLVLPAATLAINSCAYIARITRSAIMELISKPFVLVAKAKGLSRFHVIFKHILKNAMIPIITIIGIDIGSYLNGSVLTETIFSWDGLGRYALEGIIKRDYPVIMGCVLTGAMVFVLVNLLVDISYYFIDPRIRHEKKNQ